MRLIAGVSLLILVASAKNTTDSAIFLSAIFIILAMPERKPHD